MFTSKKQKQLLHFSSSWKELSPTPYYQETVVNGDYEHDSNFTSYVTSVKLYDLAVFQFLICKTEILNISLPTTDCSEDDTS